MTKLYIIQNVEVDKWQKHD